MRKYIFVLFCLLTVGGQLSADAAEKPLYETDFQKAEIGKLPDDFLVLEGEFTVKEDGTNRVLELPGAPLDKFGAQFGPSGKEDVSVTARILGSAKGRRYPTLGVGLGGVTGYRLQVSPGKGTLEIYKDEELKTSVPYQWKPDSWTKLRLQITKLAEGGWKIEGKAWLPDAAEPKDWMISFVEKEAVSTGRASVFASPFSGKPIWFDDLKVEKAGP